MCWQPHVLATDGESVESSPTLLGAQGFTAGGGRGWQGALGVCLLCPGGTGRPVWVLRAEPYSMPNGGGEDCVAAAHGFEFFNLCI